MEEDILEKILDKKMLNILRLFYNNPEKQYYLREISKLTKVPIASCFRVINSLVESELITVITLSKFKVYKLGDNSKTRFLGPMLKKSNQALEVFINKLKEIDNVEEIILQGKENNKTMNIIIIGNNIEINLKQIESELLDKFNSKITSVILSKEQYEQMKSMGLYSSENKAIYRKVYK